MPSDKCNSIMAIDFFTVPSLISKTAFLSTTAASMLASWFYQSLPLFSFVFRSLLHYHIGDLLQYACYGFSVNLGSANKSASYAVLCLKCYPMCSKQSIVICHDWGTHPLLNRWLECTSMIEHSMFSVMAGLIEEMRFMLTV